MNFRLILRSNFLIVFYTLVGADKVTPTLLLVRIVVVLLPPAGGICTSQEKKEEFRPKRSSPLYVVKNFHRKKTWLADKLLFVTEILFENLAFDKKKSAAESFTVVNAAPLKNHPSIQSDQLSLVLCPTNRCLWAVFLIGVKKTKFCSSKCEVVNSSLISKGGRARAEFTGHSSHV